MNIKFYSVAGITIKVRSDYPITDNTFHSKFRQFEVDGPGDDNVVINHHFHMPDSINVPCEYEIYNKSQWQVFKTDTAWIFNYHSVLPEDFPHSVMGVFNSNYTVLDIYSDDIDQESYKNGRFNALTLFNTDQILFAKLLCDRNGLIIHSNGFDINGNGILLAGDSGAGKSTLSGMLKERGFGILCDDRMFVKNLQDVFWLYGNWCHGTKPDTSSISVPLKAVFFLEQSKTNKVIRIEDKKQIARKLVRSMVKPFLTPEDWGKTLTIIERIGRNVECYVLQFDLSGEICEEIEKLFQGDSNLLKADK
ncbi:MAG: hypothetical protein GY737_20860 [Desulfobacteraceae bacterium]|nr:hypothetical protein [Desulfobacteraceae bacterium]